MSKISLDNKAIVIINEVGTTKNITAFNRIEDYFDYYMFHNPPKVMDREEAEQKLFDKHFDGVTKKGH